ncbi:MAG TPA: exodeoxyribonuclease VII large subunit [Candidatus Fimihabitans intestinipullorum]|uniref:Exodeoxyribonuclease 7 large subunit n=1 Tax=Candidatus Fimihabitans intestinipullorum TaxID=2840820 RepID=A0A9D1HTE6_9BACT|nr:exodeoxyribonuclease VII large subunit [Candidatus Fimihabitans intestinipullorum]
MDQNDKYLTVSAMTRYLKHKFDTDQNLRHVFLKGEISNFKAHTTGHMYFSVKDEASKINAIMFASSARKLNFVPADGMKVLLVGRISVYEATGNYQIYVEQMMEDGIGNLYVAFEKLKKQLASEGLFAPEHKKKIPKIPERVGIVTAATGAAIKDILSTIKRRYPICETILFPSLVQGDAAAEDIVRNIKLAQTYDLDVLIIGRGGGSIEDLWPFNEEIVARAIYECPIPTISAVGHEIDYTIADFVADLRAPTPTGAAEIAVPNMVDLQKLLAQFRIRLNEGIYKKVNYQRLYLESVQNSFVLKNPMMMFDGKKQTLDYLLERANQSVLKKVERMRTHMDHIKQNYLLLHPEELYKEEKLKLGTLMDKLELVNPMNVLKRGYTLTYLDDHTIGNAEDLSVGDQVKIKFYDGTILSTVTGKED